MCELSYTIAQQLPKIEKSLEYKNIKAPLYRGILKEFIDIDKYKVNKIHYWAAFSSSSKDKKVAVGMARRDKQQDAQVVVFEVYVSNKNSPSTNIELPQSWSFYPSEQEVLLLPFFCFQVVSIKNKPEEGITCITVIEVPN